MTCQGTHVWIKAPCGATVGVCDGLVHRFARMRLRDGDDGGDDNKAKTLYSGGGALGLSSMVKAPPSRRSAEEEDADACADPSLDRRRCGFKRRTVAHFSADGVSGQVWAKKPFWRSVAAEPVGDGRALEADARAAFAEAGLALLPAATDAADVPAGNALEGGEYTCDGHKSWPGLPCAGEARYEGGSKGRSIEATCSGAYTGVRGWRGGGRGEEGGRGAAGGRRRRPRPTLPPSPTTRPWATPAEACTPRAWTRATGACGLSARASTRCTPAPSTKPWAPGAAAGRRARCWPRVGGARRTASSWCCRREREKQGRGCAPAAPARPRQRRLARARAQLGVACSTLLDKWGRCSRSLASLTSSLSLPPLLVLTRAQPPSGPA